MHQIIINEDLSDHENESDHENDSEKDNESDHENDSEKDNESDHENDSDQDKESDHEYDSDQDIFIKKKTYKLSAKPVNKEINKYKYKGNLNDYDSSIKNKKKESTSLKLTFNDYKNMLSKKNSTLL